MVTLNHIVAVAMVHGPQAGLRRLTEAEADPALAGHYRVDAADEAERGETLVNDSNDSS